MFNIYLNKDKKYLKIDLDYSMSSELYNRIYKTLIKYDFKVNNKSIIFSLVNDKQYNDISRKDMCIKIIKEQISAMHYPFSIDSLKSKLENGEKILITDIENNIHLVESVATFIYHFPKANILESNNDIIVIAAKIEKFDEYYIMYEESNSYRLSTVKIDNNYELSNIIFKEFNDECINFNTIDEFNKWFKENYISDIKRE